MCRYQGELSDKIVNAVLWIRSSAHADAILSKIFPLLFICPGFDYKTCNVIQALDLHNPDDEDNEYESQENLEKPARDLVLLSFCNSNEF